MLHVHQSIGARTREKMTITSIRKRCTNCFFFFFASGDRIQKCFDPKELQIKMSSLLNVSNDASGRPEEFSLMNIEVFVDSEEQNWFKRAHMGKFLGIENIRTSLNDLEKCEILTRQELIPTRRYAGLVQT